MASQNEVKEPTLHDSSDDVTIENGTVNANIKDGDAALDFLKHEHAEGPLTREEERRLVRKIDWMIVPLMWCCYCLQYLDKTLINYANVMVMPSPFFILPQC